jgi:hypothetical protein
MISDHNSVMGSSPAKSSKVMATRKTKTKISSKEPGEKWEAQDDQLSNISADPEAAPDHLNGSSSKMDPSTPAKHILHTRSAHLADVMTKVDVR